MCQYLHHKVSWLAWGSGVSAERISVPIAVHYIIPILQYMIRSYDHLHVQIYTSQIITKRMKFRIFRLKQLCLNRCSLFYSNYPLHISFIRPYSNANIYITKYHDWREVQEFPSNANLLQCCSLFLSNYPLNVSVIRPSSRTNIYITIFHDCHEVQLFPSNASLLQ
jgi:hypothetical protein